MTAPATFTVPLSNETATAHLMADLALLVGPGDVITLSGDLGAGKTAAARAMIRYLANDPALEVPSPTLTLAQSYDLPFPIVHADLYRINDSSELEEIGLSPLPEGTLALIEWPERAPDALPEDRIAIALRHADIESGFLITEDFGSGAIIEGDPPQPIAERYEAAVDMLAELHRDALPETVPLTPELTYGIPVFDIDAWLVEIRLMLEWY